MTVLKADDLSGDDMTTPGGPNRTRRLKYTHVSEMLEDIRRGNALEGRTMPCPLCEYLEAHIDDDVIEIEQHVWGHPEWGPPLLCETITNTVVFNNKNTHPLGDEIASMVQHDAALEIHKHSWAHMRVHMERMLRDKNTVFVDGKAMYVVLAYFNNNHPNPRKFLERPHVAAMFPGVDFALFAAPDFDEPDA